MKYILCIGVFILSMCASLVAQTTTKWFKLDYVQENHLQHTTLTWPKMAAIGKQLPVQVLDLQDHATKLYQLQFGQLAIATTPGHLYQVVLLDDFVPDTIVFAAPSNSTGEIKVYFNNPINTSVGLANNLPAGTTGNQCVDATISMINAAKYTIDVAMYNTNYTAFVNALKAANARGVRVRMIADDEQNNSALSTNPGFPVFYGSANQQGIMHNKFVIVDANSTNADEPWVSSGSTNWTTGQILYDPNNLILIQDQALARAYQIEFEEMWGGNGDNFNATLARFGENKTDNTPHYFDLNGTQVELWFSPSDQLNSRIRNVINSAGTSLDFGLLLITKDDLASNLVAKHQQNVRVRGIINDDDNLATPYYTMKNAGIPVFLHTDSDIFHHKYAIVDADSPASDPLVLTGSHNWTYSAETWNDENTLIIHSPIVTDLYRKEFERRFVEVNPLSTPSLTSGQKIHVYPNPVSDELHVQLEKIDAVRLEIYHVQGLPVLSPQKNGTNLLSIACHSLSSGMYLLVITDQDGNRHSIPFCRV